MIIIFVKDLLHQKKIKVKIAFHNPTTKIWPINPTQNPCKKFRTIVYTNKQPSHSRNSTQICYVENSYTFIDRQTSLSDPLKRSHQVVSLSEPQYEPT